LAIRLGCALLAGLDWLVPRAVHRQLLLTFTLMGMLDVVLDETASSGERDEGGAQNTAATTACRFCIKYRFCNALTTSHLKQFHILL
jgi:hypothetical protein